MLTFFLLGFIAFRSESVLRYFRSGDTAQAAKTIGSLCSISRLRDNFKQRRHEEVLEDWAHLESYSPEALSLVVMSLLALGRPEDLGTFIAKTVASLPYFKQSIHEVILAVANPLCEVRRQHVTLALRDICDHAIHCLNRFALRELIAALSKANDEKRVAHILREMASQKEPASAKELGSFNIVIHLRKFHHVKLACLFKTVFSMECWHGLRA